MIGESKKIELVVMWKKVKYFIPNFDYNNCEKKIVLARWFRISTKHSAIFVVAKSAFPLRHAFF